MYFSPQVIQDEYEEQKKGQAHTVLFKKVFKTSKYCLITDRIVPKFAIVVNIGNSPFITE